MSCIRTYLSEVVAVDVVFVLKKKIDVVQIRGKHPINFACVSVL